MSYKKLALNVTGGCGLLGLSFAAVAVGTAVMEHDQAVRHHCRPDPDRKLLQALSLTPPIFAVSVLGPPSRLCAPGYKPQKS